MDSNFSKFNYARNKDKLLINLINMIEGILSDGVIDAKEMIFLDTWLLESESISQNYCVKAIRARIADILEDGVITPDELAELKEDLLKIQQQLLDLPELDLFSTESDKHLLEGLCKGMIANHELHDSEIRFLDWWLTSNGMLKDNYPGKELYALVKEILKDGVITPEERASLKLALIDYTGCDIESGAVDGLATRLPIDKIESLELRDANICLTGTFLCGKRKACEAEIIAAGGVITGSINQKLNYLIVGTLSSKDWVYQSSGRKIEKAVEYRDQKGINLKIISEEQWKTFTS